MNIKELLGDAYREDMTAGELMTALEGVALPDEKQLRESVTKANQESATRKKELKELREQVAALQRENTIAQHTAGFLDMGYSKESAQAAATALTDGDAKTLMEQHRQFLEGYKTRIEAELIQGTRPPAPGKTDPAQMTKERLAAMTLGEKQTFAREHPQEYEALYKR